MRTVAIALLMSFSVSAAEAAPPEDPLKSPLWADMVARLLKGGQVLFDDKVKVIVPTVVENQAQVPVTADARGLAGVKQLVVFADLNPIQHVLTLTPGRSAPYVSFRMKVEQGTPVRAAALTDDGVWHVGGVYLDAAGGGCSAPAMARNEESWTTTLGETQGRIWRDVTGLARARFRIRHPMDTGLARDNTPAYYIDKVTVSTGSGGPLATLEMFEPMSEDPTVTLLVPLPASEGALAIEGRDINGGVYRSNIPAPWRQSGVPVPRG
jgi:sulfur-oxidizing protein SoxY